MSYQMKKSLAALVAIFFLAAAFSGAHTASADNNEIEFEKITLVIDEQNVDLDGDGNNEPVSAYFVINDRGTVSMDPYKNFKFLVKFDGASIEPTNDGQIAVEMNGRDVETGQEYSFSFKFDPQEAASGSGSTLGGGDIILVDIVGSSAIQVRATVQIYF